MIQQKQPEMEAKHLSKAQQLDIITTLPQTITKTILCLLPIEEAARTSILSRKWRYKWTKIPELVFSKYTIKRPRETEQPEWYNHVSGLEYARIKKEWRCKLLHAIQQVMLLRQGPIHEFFLSMDAHATCFELDQIIFHLSRNHTVKKLTFYFYDQSTYCLPSSFFSLHHLTDLDLEYCIFNHKPILNGFGNLTRLSLSHTRISSETLLHLLSVCPSLKSLSLIIYEEEFLGDEKPNIMELLKCLPLLEHLTTWGYIIRLAPVVPKELPTSLLHLKYICIRQMCFVDGYGLPFLAVLTKCCPNLEKIKLVIDVDWYNENEIESVVLEECSVKLEEYSDVWLEHMNELKIEWFTNFTPELKFVKFIMARSPKLNKVILETWMADKNEELEMLNVLSSAPHASPAEIVVKNLHK